MNLIGSPSGRAIGRSKKGRAGMLAVLVISAGTATAQMAPSHAPTQSQPSPHGQMTVTQSGNPHGSARSSLKKFAADCGVPEMSEKNVQIFGLAKKSWTALRPQDSGDQYTEIAKVWSDAAGKPRVVSFSESLSETGDALRVAHMCYSPSGSLRRSSEHYVNVSSCGCGRQTESSYEGQGKQTKHEQTWYKVPSHELMSAPADAAKMPPVLDYQSVAELPFANLLKGKNATSH